MSEASHPCERFSASDDGCDQCEKWWNARIDAIADGLGQAGEWLPWATPFLGDGVTRFERGNPIVSARSRRLDRAFRVILMDEPTAESGITGWVTEHDTLGGEIDFPSAELVVVTVWSKEAVDLAQKLLATWMIPEATPAMIDQLLSRPTPRRRRSRDT
jgi:hypothetical protein